MGSYEQVKKIVQLKLLQLQKYINYCLFACVCWRGRGSVYCNTSHSELSVW